MDFVSGLKEEKMLKSLTGLFVYGTYFACLFGIGFVLLPYAVGAHIAMAFMKDPEVEELEERITELESRETI